MLVQELVHEIISQPPEEGNWSFIRRARQTAGLGTTAAIKF